MAWAIPRPCCQLSQNRTLTRATAARKALGLELQFLPREAPGRPDRQIIYQRCTALALTVATAAPINIAPPVLFTMPIAFSLCTKPRALDAATA
jgi:hypothetical protein